MLRNKYIKTKSGVIVVFNESIKHTEFSHLNPVSAGFIQFIPEKRACHCYGESVALDLKSNEEDSQRATTQFFGF